VRGRTGGDYEAPSWADGGWNRAPHSARSTRLPQRTAHLPRSRCRGVARWTAPPAASRPRQHWTPTGAARSGPARRCRRRCCSASGRLPVAFLERGRLGFHARVGRVVRAWLQVVLSVEQPAVIIKAAAMHAKGRRTDKAHLEFQQPIGAVCVVDGAGAGQSVEGAARDGLVQRILAAGWGVWGVGVGWMNRARSAIASALKSRAALVWVRRDDTCCPILIP